MAKKRKQTLTAVNRRLDILARDICKLRANFVCAKCGVKGDSSSIEWAHIEKRANKAIRWSEYNTLPLCNSKINGCHSWFDFTRTASTKWLMENYPDHYFWLTTPDSEGVLPAEKKVDLSLKDRLALEVELKSIRDSLK